MNAVICSRRVALPPGRPRGAANVMPLGLNPMASPGASSPMKPADCRRGRCSSPAPACSSSVEPGSLALGLWGQRRKRGRPRKYGPDGSIGLGLNPAASAEASGRGFNSNPDGKSRERPPGSGKKKQLDALGAMPFH